MSTILGAQTRHSEQQWLTTGTSAALPPLGALSVSMEPSIADVVRAWLDAVRFTSSLDAVRRDPNYQLLRRIGWPAVTILLNQIRQGRARIMCAELLADITGENPVAPAVYGHAPQIGDAWVQWGRLRGFL